MENQEIIIQGITLGGKPFRPSDWVDRMCSTYASFGDDKKLRYSPYLKPKLVNNVRSLSVDMKLKDVNPAGFEQLMQFAKENQLSVINPAGEAVSI
ncbi:DUF3579 domain-containing protein [Methylophilus sp. 3sh_L]|uniref:DUF3579 domain-containing protein n=1 Tax=Methylophilus sp. 3sh_L TaxID=3377114 RepID=UPI00398E6A4E